MKYNFGDKLKLTLNSNEIIEGLFVPSNNNKFIVIKLDSGYNQSINQDKIKSIEILEEFKKQEKNKTKIKQDSSLPLIVLLHIGGTIASKVDYKTGGVSAQLEPSDLINIVPELAEIAQIETVVLSNVLSGNIRFEHYNIIGKKILELLNKNLAGIIVSHGTDTLHYSTAALSFILQNIKVPVVFVGSQRSSDRPSTDSSMNLVSAARFIIDQFSRSKPLTGIFASMHSFSDDYYCNIYSGLNLRKVHSSRRDAFKQINSLPIAKITNNGKIDYSLTKNSYESSPLFEPAFFRSDIKVGILKAHPNMFSEELQIYSEFNGLVIEGTGLGNLPVENNDKNSNENKKILNSLQELCKKVPVVISTQCINGSTNLNVYSYGILVKKAGAFESKAMITETAFIKLAWLLSNFSKEEIKELWERNFVGEIIPRNVYEKDYW